MPCRFSRAARDLVDRRGMFSCAVQIQSGLAEIQSRLSEFSRASPAFSYPWQVSRCGLKMISGWGLVFVLLAGNVRLLGAGVGVAVGFLQAGLGDCGVNLGGGEGGVTEEGLYGTEVGSVVQEMGRERVTQLVRGDVEGDLGVLEIFLEQLVDGTRGKAFAKFGNEEGALVHVGEMAVFLDGFGRVGTDGDHALLGAFSHDPQHGCGTIDLFGVEAGQFGKAKAGGVEKFQDGGVAMRHPLGRLLGKGKLEWKREKVLHLFEAECDGEFFLGFG